MSKWITAMLLALVALLTAWWLRTPDVAALASPSGTDSSDAAPRVASPADGSGPSAAASEAAAARREQMSGTTPPTAHLAKIRVVVFPNRPAAAGAIVRYQPPGFTWQGLERSYRDELSRLHRDGEAFLRRIGAEVECDADGRCVIPLAEASRIVARSGELYGELHAKLDTDQEQLVVVRPDHTLRVLVVDAEDRPLPDVVVQAAKANDGARLHLGTTGADGRVELPHAQILAGGEASLAVRVYAVPPGGETPSLDCDLTAPPPEIIVRVAGRGSLTVRLLDARDAPVDPAYLGDRSVWLAAFDEGPVAHARMAEGFNRQKWVATVGPQGIARFSGVALGRYLVVRSGNFGMTAGCIGPTAANPDVQVNLQEPADAAVVIGAVLAADGSPFADQRLSVMYRAGLSSGWTDTLTDGEGRMRCLLGAHCVGEDVTVSAGTPTHRTDDAAELRVELPSRTIRPGLNDLGTVRLAAPAVLVAGRLVRADGVEAARVQLSIERRAGRSWHQVWELRPEWKPDGSFTVQGAIPTGTPLRLKIGPGSHLPVAPIECQAGAREVEIHLRAAGTVTATFLVDENTRAERLGFDLRRTQPPEDRDERWRRTLDVWSLGSRASGGRVERKWSGLVPGTYDLAVLCRGQAEPITELQSIAVGGRPCKDPRLKGIDLRNRIHEFEVRVSGRGGKLITDRDALVVVRNAHGTWYGYTLHKGVVTLDTSSSLDLMVLAPGYRTAVIEKVREARTIALEPEPTCALKVSLPAALPDGIELQLDLRPQLRAGRDAYIRIDNGRGGQVESILAEKVVLGGDGTATLSPHIPGEYSVGVTLRSQGGRAASVVTDVVPRSISLPAATPVVLRVGADALQNALQRLRRN